MPEPSDKKLPKLPATQASAKAVRSVTKATVGSIPVAGAALTELVENLMPDPDKLEQERWAGEVNECLDGLHGRVDGVEDQLTGRRSVELLGPTAAVLKVMLEKCPDGRRNQFWDWAKLSEELPELTEEAFRDAAGELEHFGLVEPLRTIGGPLRVRLAPSAYAAADKPIMGWDTRADARALAQLALEKDGTIASKDLHDQTGWPLRRFNPALALVLNHIGDGRVSRTLGTDYVAGWFFYTDAERFALKQMSKE